MLWPVGKSGPMLPADRGGRENTPKAFWYIIHICYVHNLNHTYNLCTTLPVEQDDLEWSNAMFAILFLAVKTAVCWSVLQCYNVLQGIGSVHLYTVLPAVYNVLASVYNVGSCLHCACHPDCNKIGRSHQPWSCLSFSASTVQHWPSSSPSSISSTLTTLSSQVWTVFIEHWPPS